MDKKLQNLQPSSDNFLSDEHFLTHLKNLNVQDFFTINLTKYNIKLPKINLNFDTIIIPIRIISFNNNFTTFKDDIIGHTNVVVYDKKNNIINLFEPHGKEFMGYNPLNIDISGIIHYYINELLNIKAKLCKISGLQGKQNLIYPNSGHCTAWALLYVETTLLGINLDIDSKDSSFLDNFIRKYITFVKNNSIVSKTNFQVNPTRSVKININHELIINYIKYLFQQFHLNNNNNNKLICNELLSFKYYYTELFNNTSLHYKHPKPFRL